MAENGEMEEKSEGWSNSPVGYAAKIILVDQFSRHIYRGNTEKIKVNISKNFLKNRKMTLWH